MEPWWKRPTPRKEAREGRSFNPDEFAIALDQVIAGSAGNGVNSDLRQVLHDLALNHSFNIETEIPELLGEASGLTAEQLRILREEAKRLKERGG
jgi:hypothetical protein